MTEQKCPRCGGKGWVMRKVVIHWGGGICGASLEKRKFTCPDCEGTGKEEKDAKVQH